MDLNALKCIQIHIPQKGPTNVKNGKKCQKITNNCKISEITKNDETMTQIDKNVKQCKKMPKMVLKCKKWPNFGGKIDIVFLAQNYLKNGTSHFHTMFGSRVMKFDVILG